MTNYVIAKNLHNVRIALYLNRGREIKTNPTQCRTLNPTVGARKHTLQGGLSGGSS